MKSGEIQDLLDEIWASEITSYDFDMIRNKLLLNLKMVENGVENQHVIEFLNVSSYFYINGTEDMRTTFGLYEDGDYLELTSILFIKEKANIITVSKEKWIEQYKSEINIAIEIWDKYLFIEAEMIRINGSEFPLTL